MLLQQSFEKDFSLYALRRKELVRLLKEKYPAVKKGKVVLFAGFETERYAFRQESNFYYFTGIVEPGVVLTIDLDGSTTLYVPQYGGNRSQWVSSVIDLVPYNKNTLGLTQIVELGDRCPGYMIDALISPSYHRQLLTDLTHDIIHNVSIYMLYCPEKGNFFEVSLIAEHIDRLIPGLMSQVTDISSVAMQMRRKKDMREIEYIYKAIEITQAAHDNAASSIASGVRECELQGIIDGTFISLLGRTAFPSIVATGKNSTVLHYTHNKDELVNGDVVVIDIGAEYAYYCADITRTYPVSGVFSSEQKKIYNIVLDTQEYIASQAKPGMWLSCKQYPDRSLHHLAYEFLNKQGYAHYFPHGIGHFLGLDVHDVGDYQKPLEEGDVFTIEPGIYISEKNIGIRIEDDYWMAKGEVVCLSDRLPKKAEDIESFLQEHAIASTKENDAEA